jgi:hypothetical protein
MSIIETTPTSAIPAVWTGTNIYGQILLLVASIIGGMATDTSGVIVVGVSLISIVYYSFFKKK